MPTGWRNGRGCSSSSASTRSPPPTTIGAAMPPASSMPTSRAMLTDRVAALREANIYERQSYRHIVGMPALRPGERRSSPRRRSWSCAPCATGAWTCSPPASISIACAMTRRQAAFRRTHRGLRQLAHRHAAGDPAVAAEEFGMPDIEVYTQPWCPFCAQALSLLGSKGVAFREIDAPHGSAARQEAITSLWWADHRSADLHRRAAHRWLRRPGGA